MNGDRHSSTVDATRKVCLESGFFNVVVHDIERKSVFELMKAFIDHLPVKEKRLVVDSTRAHGYTVM